MIYLNLPVPVNCKACACYGALRHECRAMELIDRERDNEVGEDKPEWCPINEIVKVETNIYDECERITGCTVEILRNSVTGEESVGWYRPREDDNV